MSPPVIDAAVLSSLGRGLGMLALLVPIAVAAARSTPARYDRVVAAASGLAAAVCALVIIGLVLSSFAGVGRDGWLAGLGVVDLALGGIALWRVRRGRLKVPSTSRLRLVLRPSALGSLRFLRPLPTLLGLVAVTIATSSVVLSIATAQRQARRSHFTQLWMLTTTRGGVTEAAIGVTNLEGEARTYRLVVSIQGHTLLASSIRVARSGSWTTEVPVPPAPHRLLMTATLYRSGETAAYRETNLWTPAP